MVVHGVWCIHHPSAAHGVFIIQVQTKIIDNLITLELGGKCKQMRKRKIKNSESATLVDHHPAL